MFLFCFSPTFSTLEYSNTFIAYRRRPFINLEGYSAAHGTSSASIKFSTPGTRRVTFLADAKRRRSTFRVL